MNRPTMLLQQVLMNYGLMLKLAIDRDVRVIEHRVKNEGMSFLTITLPTLDDALLQGLTEGRLSSSMFNGFKPFKRRGSYPGFLSGFFRRIFGPDGVLLEAPCFDSIEAVRQISRLFKKVELPCSDTRINQAFERYNKNEQDISKYSRSHFDSSPNWSAVCGYLWSDLELRASNLYCSPGVFGSGATSERYRLNQRLHVREWPKRGEREFPISYHSSHREDDRESFENISILNGRQERPVRIVTVPKTLKTPRIIAVEPSYAMLRQQSIWLYLQRYLEGKQFSFESIRFKDQSENRRLACVGSVDGSLATIDLSDASDRVSNRLVASTFKSCPSFTRMIFAARTRQATMPDGKLRNLRKFASMGSALCFPIEAMVFFTIVLTSLLNQSGMRPSRRSLISLSKQISIYGDDIIVPTQMAAGVVEDLEAFGLLVNHTKSYTTGFFRESCGGDFYRGVENTPIYVRCLYDNSGKRLSDPCIAAYISLSNQFYLKGLWHVSQYIRDQLARDRIKPGRSSAEIGGLYYHSCIYTDASGWSSDLHQYTVRTFQPKPGSHDDTIDSYRAAMLYSFQSKEVHSFHKNEPFELEDRTGTVLHGGIPLDGIHRVDMVSGRSVETHRPKTVPQCDMHRRAERGRVDESESAIHGLVHESELSCGTHFKTWSWKPHEKESRGSLDLDPRKAYDGTSVRPYSLKLKSRRTPTPVGLCW